MITYRATLDVSRELAQYLGRLLRAERRDRGTRKGATVVARCVGPALVPAERRCPVLAHDQGISRATGYRYLDEVVAVLADQAPISPSTTDATSPAHSTPAS